MKVWRVLAAAILATGAASALAGDDAPVSFEMLQQGRKIFRNNCRECHELDWPLAKVTDRAGWEETLEQMAGKGAILGVEAKELVIEYLLAKSVFQTKCVTCHEPEKALSERKSPEEWRMTVTRMAGMQEGLISEGEQAAIAAYLAAERGEK
jgi:mono/diheme cytochrome c family protein